MYNIQVGGMSNDQVRKIFISLLLLVSDKYFKIHGDQPLHLVSDPKEIVSKSSSLTGAAKAC